MDQMAGMVAAWFPSLAQDEDGTFGEREGVSEILLHMQTENPVAD